MQWRAGFPHWVVKWFVQNHVVKARTRSGHFSPTSSDKMTKGDGLGTATGRPRHWPFPKWSWSAWSSGARSPHQCSPPWQQADSSGDNGMSWLLCAPAPTRKARTSLGWSIGICYHTCSPHMPATDGLTIKSDMWSSLCALWERWKGLRLPLTRGLIIFSITCLVISSCYLSRDLRQFMGNMYNKIITTE